MEWTDIITLLTVVGGLGTVWWRLNSRIDRLDAKFDTLSKLLTDNLIALNRDIGELRGQAHTHPHTPS